MENGRDKGKVYRYVLISFISLHDCKLVFILLSVTIGSSPSIHGGISEVNPYLKEGTSVFSQTQPLCSSPSVLAAPFQYSIALAKNMSTTSPKRDTAQHFMVITEATSARSRVGQSSVCPLNQMQSFEEITQDPQSVQSMLDKLIHDIGGEATGEQTLPPTGTSPIPSGGLSVNTLLGPTTTTLAPLVGDFDTSPSQSDGVSATIMPQLSTGNSLPEYLHEAGKELLRFLQTCEF